MQTLERVWSNLSCFTAKRTSPDGTHTHTHTHTHIYIYIYTNISDTTRTRMLNIAYDTPTSKCSCLLKIKAILAK